MGGGVTKGLAKGFKSFRKYSLGDRAAAAIEGEDLHNRLHFISTGIIKNADALTAAEKDAKNAQAQADALAAQQAAELADLNNQENSRIKKLLYSGRAGARGYRGGPLFRARPSNTAGAGAPARAGASAAGASAAAGAALASFRAGGMRGGLMRGPQQ